MEEEKKGGSDIGWKVILHLRAKQKTTEDKMKIDIWAHIFPEKYKNILCERTGLKFRQLEATPPLFNLEARFRIMDKFDELVQVLVPAGPPLEQVVGPEDAVELARIANDEMAKMVNEYPDRFTAAVAILPLNNIEEALTELDRAINVLRFRGIFIFTPIYSYVKGGKYPPSGGKPIDSPELIPIYERMVKYNLPIWLHPLREATIPDYANETKSKYAVFEVFGWPYETTVAMTRLVFSGILEKYPNLKFITHHCGAMVPYFDKRISLHYDWSEMRTGRKYKNGLTKSPIEYYRMFYNDTAVSGSTPALMCAYAFFGTDHLLFGTDFPFDSQTGTIAVRETIRSIEQMDISDSEKKKIFEDNARKLLRLPV